MNRRTILGGLLCFVAGVVAALSAADAFARPIPVVPSSYTDTTYGFTITPPAFPKLEKDAAMQAAMFFAPVKNSFASNLGVSILANRTTLSDYIKSSQEQFKAASLKITSERKLRVSDRDAVLWEYEGEASGRKLKFMALGVIDSTRVVLVACTSTAEDYDALSRDFKASLDSFKLIKSD